MPAYTKDVLSPAEALNLAPEIGRHPSAKVWVYRYAHAVEPWRLSIATHAQPGSRMLSLGGFRIAPESRTSIPGWNPDHEAIDLAIGMDEKVYWSRLLKIGGPHVQRDFSRIVGGKCVMQPTAGSRVGEPRDRELLDFAIECFKDVEKMGFFLTTGQDLGHGIMSDGRTPSLHYLNAQYKGSVISDTGAPTAEGNYWMLVGQLKGAGIPLKGAVVGLIGAGNIGRHIIDHLLDDGARRLHLFGRDRLGQATADQFVHGGPQVVDLERLFERDIAYEDAPVLLLAHQARLLEHAEGFADRAARDTQTLRKPGLGQLRARAEFTLEDHPLDFVLRRARQGS